MKILVTGATGFIGRNLCKKLLSDGQQIRCAIRSTGQKDLLYNGVEFVHVEAINSKTDWSQALIGIETVIHLAARVHVMHETADDPLKEYLAVNSAGTINLASQAQLAGVKRFIFMSSVGVNGDSSGNKSFTETDVPAPHNMYSISKKDAEDKLQKLASDNKMKIVIIRAPLTYGKSNLGNFHALVQVVKKGIPLPLSAIQNLKSFIYVGNLVDALSICISHPSAKGIYLVSDGEDISTTELITRLYKTLGRPARLFYFPFVLLRLAAFVTGKSEVLNRLTNSLTVSTSKIRHELDWKPPYSMSEGLKETLS